MCEKLAEELVDIETEIAKRTTLLESIKRVIAERKTDVIKNKILGEKLHFPGKTYMVLDVATNEIDVSLNGFFVTSTFAVDPEWVEKSDLKLSVAETKVLAAYKEAYENYYDLMGMEAIVKLKEAAGKMRKLKNKLNLISFRFWSFRFEDATSSRFFEETGIDVYREGRYSAMLEYLIVKR